MTFPCSFSPQSSKDMEGSELDPAAASVPGSFHVPKKKPKQRELPPGCIANYAKIAGITEETIKSEEGLQQQELNIGLVLQIDNNFRRCTSLTNFSEVMKKMVPASQREHEARDIDRAIRSKGKQLYDKFQKLVRQSKPINLYMEEQYKDPQARSDKAQLTHRKRKLEAVVKEQKVTLHNLKRKLIKEEQKTESY